MILTAINPSTDDYEKAYLTLPVAAGATSLTVGNNDVFAQDDRIMIGEMGRERTEIVTVTSVSGGNTIVTGATTFSHDPDEPVYRLRYDQAKFYRSTTTSDGSYTLLATVDLDVDNEGEFTVYDDTTGTSAYFYKISFYHSVSTLESSFSDVITGAGYSRNTVGFLIDEVLREVGDPDGLNVDRTEVIGWFNEANDDLITSSKKPYSFLNTRTTLSTVADTETVSFPSDMWKLDRIDYLYTDDSGDTQDYPVRVVSLEEFRMLTKDNTIDNDDQLQLIALDEARDMFRLYPTPETSQSGVIYIYYYKTFTEIDSEGDTLETPNPRAYKLFAMGKYYRKRGVTDPSFLQISDRYFADYQLEKQKLQRIQNKDAGSPKSFKFLPQSFKGNREY